jgi:hypothetical protein
METASLRRLYKYHYVRAEVVLYQYQSKTTDWQAPLALASNCVKKR